MNTEVINQIKEALTPVAEKIGQGAEYVWGVVVRQQIAEGIGDLLIALFGIVIGIISFRIVKFALKKREEAGIYSDWGALAGLVGFFGGVATVLMFVLGLYSGILTLINPEFYAIEFFINLVK